MRKHAYNLLTLRIHNCTALGVKSNRISFEQNSNKIRIFNFGMFEIRFLMIRIVRTFLALENSCFPLEKSCYH